MLSPICVVIVTLNQTEVVGNEQVQQQEKGTMTVIVTVEVTVVVHILVPLHSNVPFLFVFLLLFLCFSQFVLLLLL